MTRAEGNGGAVLLRWVPAIAALALVASLIIAGWAFYRDRRHADAIEDNRAVIIALERMMSSLKDVETGQRGYLLTGQDDYLQPYRSGLNTITADQERIRARLGSLAAPLFDLVQKRIERATSTIEAYRVRGPSEGADLMRAGIGKALMDQVRLETARLQGQAMGRIERVRASANLDYVLWAISLLGFVLSSVVLAILAVVRRREQQASQMLLEGVLENAPVGLGILDEKMRIRHVNHALTKMSERALSAAPGMSIWDVLPQMRETLEPRLLRVAEGGRAASVEIEMASNVRADQTRSYQASFYPLHHGRSVTGLAVKGLEGVGMVIADMTARKRLERTTRESEERFRSLVQASADTIWTTDAEGAFVRPQLSWMRFTGQSEEESMGWGRVICLHPDDREKTQMAWAEAKRTGTAFSLENRVRRHDGEWRYMSVNIAPVCEEDGTVREWVGSHTDITARKEAELALSAAKETAESANRAKSTFLANMSHELRTPLSAVIGYSEMLEEEVEDSGQDDMLVDLGKIKSNAKHLLGLINDVLDLSKVEANKMDVIAEDIDVSAFVRDAANTVESLIHRKNNTLRLDLSEDVGRMFSDSVKLRQCLFNLLSNAAKFTENGTITLSVHRHDGETGSQVSFAVSDTGIGMTPEQLARLFQRFSQADETTTRKFGGTGLGLALSRAFAQLLGGDIIVESRQGQGSTFTLRVPANLPKPEPVKDIPMPELDLSQAGLGDVVLVIDDEAAQRDLMTRFLLRQGFGVVSASDGQSGLDLARSVRPRVILLDVMMPGMDGWAVLSALKADPDTSKIPVVMVSFVADQAMGTALGASDTVPKPVDWERLKNVIAQFREAGSDVLIVDDDADMRERLRSVLEKNGWSVQEAVNGAEALQKVTHAAPHLILLDLTMPIMDGFSFLHHLRATPGCGDIPVIVLSARDISAPERAQLSGADRVLKKGDTSMRELTEQIRTLDGERAGRDH